ncbi:MAG: amidohydrolase family protein [Gammaproteobacteria bacterium]|nr:amidohydrolase family protein [Gammaproteobacteria bacterium]
MNKGKLFLGSCFALTLALPAMAQTIVIHAGTLIAIPGTTPLVKQSIVIEDGKVLRIENGYVRQDDSQTIDLSCCHVLPGFIDMHVHLTSKVAPGGKLRVVTENSADLALRAAEYAKLTIEAGFTTVVDLGTGRRAHEKAIYALRDATREHRLPGPRIVAVGSPISPTGKSRTGLYRSEVEDVVGPQAVCNGADDCRRAVREQVKRGADAINFYNTGSLLDDYLVEQTFTDAEMLAIVETAHSLGRKVIADGHTAAGVNAAIRAGADVLDTMPWPDKETWRLIRKNKTFFSPHLYAFAVSLGDTEESLRDGTTHWLPEPILKRMLTVKQNTSSAQEAHQRGVRIAFGSDTGVINHGDNAGEFEELVKNGLSTMDAITTATVNAASALGMEQIIGSLKKGYAADIVAFENNPLQNISELRQVVFVMRDGVVYRNEL